MNLDRVNIVKVSSSMRFCKKYYSTLLLVEDCTGIAEVMGSNSVKPDFFFFHLILQLLCISSVIFLCSSNKSVPMIDATEINGRCK